MIRLRPHLDFVEDETPMSWASRMAALHAGCGPDRFLTDLGLSAHELGRGDPQTVMRLAEAGGADPELVQRNAVRRLAKGKSVLRHEEFHDDFALSIQSRVCPCCLVDDVASGPKDMRVLLRGRLDWLLPTVRVCPTHRVRLVDIRGDLLIFARRPMSFYATENWKAVRHAADVADDAAPGALQSYVLGRLRGEKGPQWLDDQPIHLAAKACEILGAVALRGARPNAAAFSDAERDEAEAVGIGIAEQGPDAIRELFSKLQSQCHTDDGHAGPKAMFGYLFEWATEAERGYDRGPLLDLLFTHIVETMPVGPGDTLFGRPVEQRRIHSVRTLTKASGLNHKRLRKVLEARAVIGPEMLSMSDNRAWFDAAAGEAVAAELTEGLTLKQARPYLGVPLTLMSGIIEAGLLRPLVAPDAEHQLGEYRFARAELDGFLSCLLDGVEVVEAPEEGFVTVKNASHAVVQSVPALLAAILDGRLHERRRLSGVHGIAGLLVSHKEVRELFRPDHLSEVYSAHRLKRLLRTSDRVVAALMRERPGGSILATVPAPPELPRADRVVPAAVAEAFDREFVSLANLARERGVGNPTINRWLDAWDIAPAFDPKEVRASFYRRADLPPDL